MKDKILLRRLLLFWSLLLITMFLTEPGKLPVFFLIIPYILLTAALYYTVLFIVSAGSSSNTAASLEKRNHRLSGLIAGCGVLFVALGSIGQLTPRDVIVVLLLSTVGYFYLNRNRKGST